MSAGSAVPARHRPLPATTRSQRWITARLYEADPATRLAQYVLLGVGGVRALRALGIDPGVLHLNEGHAALAPLALAGALTAAGVPLADALDEARARTVFTTHTPVPAGNDSYPAEQVARAIARLDGRLGARPPTRCWRSAAPTPRTAGAVRGHPGRAADEPRRQRRQPPPRRGRPGEMWAGLWPERAPDEVPIAHVTNGVHVPTWIGKPMRELLARHLGEDFLERAADPATWAASRRSRPPSCGRRARPSGRTWSSSCAGARTQDRLLRGDLREYVERRRPGVRPGVLTIGFARRVATYKRLELLTRDPDWIVSLLGGERPVQVVLAGKAHPRDEEAKHSLQRLFGLKAAELVGQRVVYLDDYDLATGAVLTQGADVWLNVPRPPLEASGTSGMKSVVNGGLQLSVLDGWWAEGFDGTNGWGLPGDVQADHGAQDERDAAALHRTLDEQVVPAFYERDGDGLPQRWLELDARVVADACARSSPPPACSANTSPARTASR